MKRKKITWKCYVSDIKDNYFEAIMYGVNSKAGGTHETGEFPLEKLSTEELSNLSIGLGFTFEINLQEETDNITFQPNKSFTKQQLQRAHKRAVELYNSFKTLEV